MKNWKKFFVAAVAVGAVFSTNVAPTEAGYELNPEVKTATPALLAASISPPLTQSAPKPASRMMVSNFGLAFALTA